MRSFRVVKVHVTLNQMLHVPFSEDDVVVQTFVPERSRPAFGDGVAVRRVRRRTLGLDVGRFDDRVEGDELAVAIMDEILRFCFEFVEMDADVACVLIVVRPIASPLPRLTSSPRMREYPQVGYSSARRMTSSLMSPGIADRPGEAMGLAWLNLRPQRRSEA